MRPSRWAAAAGVLLLAAAGLLAQVTGGSVTGRVTDESGRPLSGATVTAKNTGTGIARTAVADANGSYRLSELPVGTYEFNVSASGLATEVRSGVRVLIGQQASLDFSLKVAAVAETVTVQADAPIVETTKSAISSTITTRQIDSLPLPERNFQSLVFLTPGITQSVTEATNISAAGSTGSSNTFLIDGVSNDQDALGDSRGDFSPDAIAEFEVLSSQYSAEYGQASGAIINVLTRSGGNDYHARLATYYRADGLAANNPFSQQTTPFDQWIVSTYLSGPIQKDKAFFFASYEHTIRDDTAVVGVDPAILEALGQGTQTSFPKDLREPRAVVKLDYHPTNQQTLTFRFRLDEPKTTNLGIGENAGGAVLTGETGYTLDTKNTDYVLSHSWIPSTSTVNEARFQYARQSNDITDVNCPGCPLIIRPSVITGKLPNFPQTFSEDRYQFLDSIGFNLLGKGGDHFFKAGVDYSHIEVKAFVPQNFDGLFLFTSDLPYDPANPATFPAIWQGATGNPNFDIKNNIYALYVQDQWRVTPHLTLNLGLRWDYEDQTYVKNDWQNFGPRIHFAWDATKDGKTAVRGGFGIYYDQVFLNVPLLATLFEPGRFDNQTIIAPGYPDPLSGGFAYPLPPDISVLNSHNTTPYKNVGSLGVQRELASDMALSLDFVYARGYHLLLMRDANAPPPGAGGVRPNPDVGIEYDISTIGRMRYQALQLGFQKRFGTQVGVQLAYTLADTKDNTDGSQYIPTDNYNIEADYGPSSNDIRHTLNAAVDYRGPWGILVGASGTLLSSPPYNITTGNDDNGDLQYSDRPPGVHRNSARGRSIWTVNLHLAKAIPIGPTSLQLIAEAFNLFNHINPSGYQGNLLSPQFGQPTTIATGFGPRQVQVGFRFDY